MARPTTEKICITCGKPFLPNGGRQKRCPDCKGNKPRAGRDTLTAAAQAAAELGISYGKYVAMSEEERNRAREEKTMAEQEKQTAEVTAEPEQDTLQEYIMKLSITLDTLTARILKLSSDSQSRIEPTPFYSWWEPTDCRADSAVTPVAHKISPDHRF